MHWKWSHSSVSRYIMCFRWGLFDKFSTVLKFQPKIIEVLARANDSTATWIPLSSFNIKTNRISILAELGLGAGFWLNVERNRLYRSYSRAKKTLIFFGGPIVIALRSCCIYQRASLVPVHYQLCSSLVVLIMTCVIRYYSVLRVHWLVRRHFFYLCIVTIHETCYMYVHGCHRQI